MDLLI